MCSQLLPQPGDDVPGQQQSPQSQLSRLQTLEKVRMFVWEKWECLFGKSENVCLGKVRMFVWEKWECLFGKSENVCLGKVRMFVWEKWECLFGEKRECLFWKRENVRLRKVRMFVWEKWECLFGKSENVCLEKWECLFGKSENVSLLFSGLFVNCSRRKKQFKYRWSISSTNLNEFCSELNFLLSAINSEQRSFLSQLLSSRRYLCWIEMTWLNKWKCRFLLSSRTVGFVPELLF